MSFCTTKKSTVDSDVILSLEEYRSITDEESNANEKYSKVGHLYPERNTPQFQWFKGSRDRGLNRDHAAWNGSENPRNNQPLPLQRPHERQLIFDLRIKSSQMHVFYCYKKHSEHTKSLQESEFGIKSDNRYLY